MKKIKSISSKKKKLLYISLVLIFGLCSLIFAYHQGIFFNLFGNQIQSTLIKEKDESGITRQYIKLQIDHPKAETISLDSSVSSYIGKEGMELFKAQGAKLVYPKDDGKPVLEIEKSMSKAEIQIPITPYLNQKATYILKKNRWLTKNYDVTPLLDSEKETFISKLATKLGLNQKAHASKQTSSIKEIPKAAGSVIVYNYQELISAIKDVNVGEIIFGADIDSSTVLLDPIKRSLKIDGQGHTFSFSTKGAFILNKPTDITGLSTFELKNLEFNYTGGATSGNWAPINCSDGLSISSLNSQYWSLILGNISSSNAVTQKATGFMVLARMAKLTIDGDISWYALNSNTSSAHNYQYGVITVTELTITNGAKVKIDVSDNVVIRMRTSDTYKYTKKITIDNNANVDLYSKSCAVIHTNVEGSYVPVQVNITGKETRVNLKSNGNLGGPEESIGGGVIGLFGGSPKPTNTSNTDSSFFNLTDGAVLQVDAELAEGQAADTYGIPRTATGIHIELGKQDDNQPKGFEMNLSGEGTKLLINGEGDSSKDLDYSALFRFYLVGEQKLYVKDGAKVEIKKKYGRAATVRFYGKNNEIHILDGGEFSVLNEASVLDPDSSKVYWDSSDGGDVAGAQAFQFTIDGGGTSVFDVQGKNSKLEMQALKGPALEFLAGEAVFNAGQSTIFTVLGNTKTKDVGAIKSGGDIYNFNFDRAQYYELTNSRTVDKAVSNKTPGAPVLSTTSSKAFSKFIVNGSSLNLWKKGTDFTQFADKIYGVGSFQLTGKNFSKVDSTDIPNFAEDFENSEGDLGVGLFKYSRIIGDNNQAIVDYLRQPTNADKSIIGHVKVQDVSFDSFDGVRDAADGEVVVLLNLKNSKGEVVDSKEVATQTAADYGEPIKKPGMFVWDLKSFVSSDYIVEVGGAYKIIKSPTGEDLGHIITNPENIRVEPQKVLDVLPPSTLKVDSEKVGTTHKVITGSIDLKDSKDGSIADNLYVMVKTANGWLTDGITGKNYTLIDKNSENISDKNDTLKKWKFYLPRYLVIDDGSIEVYAKDSIKESYSLSDMLNSTLTEEPNDILGNLTPTILTYNSINYSYHNAKQEDFTPSVKCDIVDSLPSLPKVELRINNNLNNVELNKGQQFDYQISVKSQDLQDSGIDSLDNVVIRLDKPSEIEFADFSKLQNATNVDYYTDNGNSVDIYLKGGLFPGKTENFWITGRVSNDATDSNIVTNVLVEGETRLENPFVAGDLDPNAVHEKMKASSNISIDILPKAEIDQNISIKVVNNMLKIYYSHIKSFTVYIDNRKYKDYSVQYSNNIKTVNLNIPINEIRNQIDVKFDDKNGHTQVIHWNHFDVFD